MYGPCELCDNILNTEKNISSLIPNEIDDILRKYFVIHYKKYSKSQKVLSSKLIMRSNQIKYF